MLKISYDVGLFPNHDAKVRHFFETTKHFPNYFSKNCIFLILLDLNQGFWTKLGLNWSFILNQFV